MKRQEIPVYGAIGKALSKESDMDDLNMAYSNAPERYYERMNSKQLGE